MRLIKQVPELSSKPDTVAKQQRRKVDDNLVKHPGSGSSSAFGVSVIRPSDLHGLTSEDQRRLVLSSRPEWPDVRVSFWLGLIEQLISDATRKNETVPLDVRSDRIDLTIIMIELLADSGDAPPHLVAALMVDLGRGVWRLDGLEHVPEELSADRLARRCLDAIPLDEADVPELAAREREFMTRDGGWYASTHLGDEEFVLLDHLRGALYALRRIVDHVEDEVLAHKGRRWLALADEIRR